MPILLSVCEAELEDVNGDERDQHQSCLGVDMLSIGESELVEVYGHEP